MSQRLHVKDCDFLLDALGLSGMKVSWVKIALVVDKADVAYSAYSRPESEASYMRTSYSMAISPDFGASVLKALGFHDNERAVSIVLKFPAGGLVEVNIAKLGDNRLEAVDWAALKFRPPSEWDVAFQKEMFWARQESPHESEDILRRDIALGLRERGLTMPEGFLD